MGERLKKQQDVQEKLTLDLHTGLGNYIKYKEEVPGLLSFLPIYFVVKV